MLYSLRRTTPISRGIREKLNGSTFVVDVKNVHGGVATGTHEFEISIAVFMAGLPQALMDMRYP